MEKEKTGMEIVLNGGEREMNSATIPIQWFFSDEVIAKNPQYILVCEWDRRRIGCDGELLLPSNSSNYFGRRYVCEVSEGVIFLPFLTPGLHRITVAAFGGSSRKGLRNHVLQLLRYDDSYYIPNKTRFVLPIDFSAKDKRLPWGVVAAADALVNVPEELFAKKPDKGIGKLVWQWVNWPYDKEPINECQYRKRKIFAFTIQILLALVVFPFYLLYLFCKCISYAVRAVIPFAQKMVWRINEHPVVAQLRKKREARKEERKLKIIAVSEKKQERMRRREEKRTRAESKKQEKELLEEARYRQWFKNNFHVAQKPDKVDLKNLPKPYTAGGRAVQRFYVGFWTLKAKVCKPFSR